MANKTISADKLPQGTLQRGKACLRCRKRKMRCDGNKPACQQCTRAKKPEGCEYDDGKGKTRTQILRETITRLEHRIRELEDPEYISPAVVLYDPHLQSESSPSSFGSPGSTSISAFPSECNNSPPEQWSHLPTGLTSPSPSPFATDIFFDEPQSFPPSFELEHVLLDIFTPHRHQCGLGIHMGRLRDSLSSPPEEQRHPALMKSIYLWACFLSRPKPLSQHEDLFLAQALDAHREGLRVGDKVIDIIQASCLLSLYFLANGRVLEGSYHASAAAALAVQCGLQAGFPPESGYNPASSRENLDLKPLKYGHKDAERIATFWMVYNMDRSWSAALRKPCVLLDGRDPWTSINCPWPHDITEYESGNVPLVASFQTVQMFLQGDMSGSYSMPAIRAKASALFHQASQLSSIWNPMAGIEFTDGHPEAIRALESTISRFLPTIAPVQQLNVTMHEEKQILVVVHTLIQTAMIHLYRRFAENDPIAYEKCSSAAKAAVEVVKYISDQDYDFLDPIIGPAWTTIAEWQICELISIESNWPLGNGADVRNDIATILYAMNGLNHRFPILGMSVAKIQKRLAEL